jgi:hypothetical protein
MALVGGRGTAFVEGGGTALVGGRGVGFPGGGTWAQAVPAIRASATIQIWIFTFMPLLRATKMPSGFPLLRFHVSWLLAKLLHARQFVTEQWAS